jgi:DnaK suppressor protein
VLSSEQAEQIRVLLEELRGELRAGLERGAEDVAPVSPDAAIGRLTRQDAMQAQQMALALRRRNQVRLQQVESALDRLDRGEFGICVRCEEEIALARLRVRPEAPLCLNCAGKRA